MTDATRRLTFALAQRNPVVGDIAGNLAKARVARAEAAEAGADIIVFTELYLSGYPIEDLALKPAFQAAVKSAVEDLAADTSDGGPAIIIGLPWAIEGEVYNAVAVLDNGQIAAIRTKHELPNYGVFDEKRVFAEGPMPGPVVVRGVRLGIPICEDIWFEDVCECLAECGAEILVVPNGSPFSWGKHDVRMNIAVSRITENHLPMIYVNQVGGQDELVFDGGSFVLNADCTLAVQLPSFVEALGYADFACDGEAWSCEPGSRTPLDEGEAAAYRACVLGLRDYVEKNRFPGVILGLSGGVDSALVAAIAADAIGPSRVHCVMLPYRYTSNESLADAAGCAEALGVRYDILPIAQAVEGTTAALKPLFDGLPPDVAEENLQSRLRGTVLMALSNKFGPLLVTTGNKSEVSVGYATLYGDMNGGFNPIKDLYKTQVYALCRYRNGAKPSDALGPDGVVIPERILTKAPTAELRENQKDQDSLPPYDVLDAILEGLVEREQSVHELIAAGFAPETVRKVERLLYLAEYKRRQSAPGIKITQRNFGRDWRYPITNRFREPA